VKRFLGRQIFTLIGAAFFFAAPAWADYEVIESSTPEISQGSTLADDANVKLPEGATLKLLKTPDGSTHELKGPYEGAIAEFEGKPECSLWARITGDCPDEPTSAIGVRSIKQPSPAQ